MNDQPKSATATDRLTRQVLYDAIEMIKANTTYYVCEGSNYHVVHPAEYERGGPARCGACFQIVDVPRPEGTDPR